MSVLTSLGILILSVLILCFLQLTTSVFALLIHYSTGRFSKAKASDLSIFFILGVETTVAFIFLLSYFILSNPMVSAFIAQNQITKWIIAGIIAVLSIIIFFRYFRKSSSTELFISRKLAHNFTHRIKNLKSRSDAFLLGLSTPLPELLFTLPIFLICAAIVTSIDSNLLSHAGIIILFALIAILPLIIVHILFSTGHNLADFIKFRTRNQTFFRITLTALYLFLALLIIFGATS